MPGSATRTAPCTMQPPDSHAQWLGFRHQVIECANWFTFDFSTPHGHLGYMAITIAALIGFYLRFLVRFSSDSKLINYVTGGCLHSACSWLFQNVPLVVLQYSTKYFNHPSALLLKLSRCIAATHHKALRRSMLASIIQAAQGFCQSHQLPIMIVAACSCAAVVTSRHTTASDQPRCPIADLDFPSCPLSLLLCIMVVMTCPSSRFRIGVGAAVDSDDAGAQPDPLVANLIGSNCNMLFHLGIPLTM